MYVDRSIQQSLSWEIGVSLVKKGEETKMRIVAAAAGLLDERGYHGTGINQILTRAGAPRGSLYFHFPGGKDEIMAAAIAAAALEVRAHLEATLRDVQTPVAAVAALVGLFRSLLVESDFRKGCPVSTVALELSGTDSPVGEACARAYREWRQLVADFLGKSLPSERADDLAEILFSLVEGALLVARTTRDLGPLDAAERHGSAIVERALALREKKHEARHGL